MFSKIKPQENIINNNNNFKRIAKEKINKIEINNTNTKDSTSALDFDKEDYSNRNNLVSYINKNNSEFWQKFELCEYINCGSTGYVYKGYYKGQNKRQVALKFLINKKQKEKKEKEKEKINSKNNQEITISKKLHNKNVVETYAYFHKGEMNYSVIEFGKYGDILHFLKDLLKRYVLSETALNYFGKQILEGLKYIHKCKIVHMDIKPENILIDANLEAKITDFSVSCSYSTFHPEDLVKFPFVGTSKYIAPEVISKFHMKIKEAEKIDVYSFGITLFFLFYGEYPYNLKDVKGKEYESILKKIQDEKLIFPENRKISHLFKDFLEKVLEKDYTKRFNINEALNHPWIKGGSEIIANEKENIGNQESFLINLITDNIQKFNEYIK